MAPPCGGAKEKWSLSRFLRPIRQWPKLGTLLREDSTFSIVGVVDDPQLSPMIAQPHVNVVLAMCRCASG